MLLVDYSTARPAPATIRAAGYGGVMRYLSFDATKNLSAAERDALHAAGLSIGLVWETTENRAAAGYAAGQADVRAAESQADALGYPADCPLFYAVDFDATVAQVAAYFGGVQATSRRPFGVYGSAGVVEGIGAPYKWQTVAWSHGRISSVAHLYQRLAPTVAHPIGATDENVTLRPFPMWGAQNVSNLLASIGAAPLIPTPTAAPAALTPQEDALTPELAARLDQIVAWLDNRINQLATNDNNNRNALAQFVHDTVAAIPGVDETKVTAAVQAALAAGVNVNVTVGGAPVVP